MSYSIAITGKGGVGKTTVAGVLVARLIARGCAPVLAVDADPNSCLDDALGVVVRKSIGSVREEAKQIAGQGMAAGISKQELLELKIAESLVESDDFDLIAMGRSEGPGCYCYANNVLKETIRQISDSYPYVVIDNEAGLENLSRRIVQDVDLLIMVTDPSKRGLRTVERLHALTGEMAVNYHRLVVVINRMGTEQLPTEAGKLAADMGADECLGIKEDGELADLSIKGESVFELTKTNRVIESIETLLDKVGVGS